MNLPKKIQKYLSKQNLHNWKIELNSQKRFSNIIVIPAIEEFKNISFLLDSLSKNSAEHLESTLILFVINNLQSQSNEIKINNSNTIQYLKNNFIDNLSSKINIGLVDVSSKGKESSEKEGGVGLARKIGMDLALDYFDYESEEQNLIVCLDADCVVNSNYLEVIVNEFKKNNFHTAVIDYEHQLPNDDIEKAAIINYEIFLRYYVLGLKYSKSHYAFHSIGSTIVCDPDSYVKVGGMNKRKAGEDFYFLEKLAKLNEINSIKGATVFPSSRSSLRVPFGTGQRVDRFKNKVQNEYLLYSPHSFEILKSWLNVFQENNALKGAELLDEANKIHPLLHGFLKGQNFEESWNSILENSKSEEQLKNQKLFWMDGFRTFKLMHYFRDNGLEMINTFEASDKLFDLMNFGIDLKSEEKIPPINVQLKYLQKFRNLT